MSSEKRRRWSPFSSGAAIEVTLVRSSQRRCCSGQPHGNGAPCSIPTPSHRRPPSAPCSRRASTRHVGVAATGYTSVHDFPIHCRRDLHPPDPREENAERCVVAAHVRRRIRYPALASLSVTEGQRVHAAERQANRHRIDVELVLVARHRPRARVPRVHTDIARQHPASWLIGGCLMSPQLRHVVRPSPECHSAPPFP